MKGVTYDTGALLAAERNDRRAWALHRGLLLEEIEPVVPAAVLAQAWRGGSRQANLVRFLRLCEIEPMGEAQARRVGVLAGTSAHDDVVDLSVVEGAVRRGDVVVSGDAEHIRLIAGATGVKLEIEPI